MPRRGPAETIPTACHTVHIGISVCVYVCPRVCVCVYLVIREGKVLPRWCLELLQIRGFPQHVLLFVLEVHAEVCPALPPSHTSRVGLSYINICTYALTLSCWLFWMVIKIRTGLVKPKTCTYKCVCVCVWWVCVLMYVCVYAWVCVSCVFVVCVCPHVCVCVCVFVCVTYKSSESKISTCYRFK